MWTACTGPDILRSTGSTLCSNDACSCCCVDRKERGLSVCPKRVDFGSLGAIFSSAWPRRSSKDTNLKQRCYYALARRCNEAKPRPPCRRNVML